MSDFRTLVEGILKESGLYDSENDEYYPDENDHTGDDSIEWTLDLPMNDQLRQLILDKGIVGVEDLQDDEGNWDAVEEFDCTIEYEIEGYPDDEDINVTNIILHGNDITQFLSEEFLQSVGEELKNSGKIELNYNDPVEEWRDDYYRSVL